MSRISRTGRSVLSGGERTFPTSFRYTEIEYRRYRIWRFFPGVKTKPLPWTLTVGVDPGTCSDPTWQQVEEGLYGLNQEQDSFLILEQQDPQNPDAYWFIQCAVARMGPDQGRYSVEVGFPGAGGGELWVHLVSDAGQAAAYFSAAYQHRKIDFTGFEKEEL